MTAYGLRAATAGELVKFRADGQFSRLYLAIPVMATVCYGTVTAAPASNDSVYQVSWTVTGGTRTDTLAGMTCLVGTSAGGSQKGVVRIRSLPSTTVLYIGECSEIDWDVGDHITIINDFAPWRRDIRINAAETIFVDYDITYFDQHSNPDPIVIMGSDIVAWLTGATVTVNLGPSTNSYVIDGSAIASTQWQAPGASATTDLTTDTPTATYNAVGTYRVACIKSTAGAQFVGYRYVHVFSAASMPIVDFKMDSCSGAFESGGWSAEITMYGQTSTLRDRSRVLLFTKDWYQGVEGSIGQQAGRENIVMQGWVVGSSITYNPKFNTIKFTVVGPHTWLKYIKGFPSGLMDTDYSDNGGGNPTRWNQMNNLTTAKALWHFLHFRSTVDYCIDVFLPTDDTRQMGEASSPGANLWDQIVTLSTTTNLRIPVCDRYGRLWIVSNPNLLTIGANRNALTELFTMTRADYSRLSLEKRVIPEYYYAEVSGVYYSSGIGVPIGAMSPGSVPRWMGDGENTYSNVIMDSKANAIILAGLMLGSGQSDPESGSIGLNASNRLVDIIPSYIRTTTAEKSETLGVVYTSIRLIPKSVRHSYSPGGFLSTDIEVEGEGTQMPAIEMLFPGEEEPPPDGGGGDPPDPPPPGGGGGGDPPPVLSAVNAVAVNSTLIKSTATLSDATPAWITENSSGPTAIIDSDCDILNKDIMFALEADKVWRTANLTTVGAATWVEVFNSATFLAAYPQYAEVELLRIVCDPKTSGKIYVLAWAKLLAGAAVGDAYLLKSSNGAVSWNYNYIANQTGKGYTVTNRSGVGATQTHLHERIGDINLTVNPLCMAIYFTGPSKFPNISGGATTVHNFNDSSPPTGAILAYHNDLLADPGGIRTAVCNDYFGVGGWSGRGDSWSTTMPLDAARVNVQINPQLPGESAESWVFWGKPSVPRALAVSRNTQAIYVGCEAQIYKSLDEGSTWTALPTVEGATDILVDPLLGGVIYYWACGSADVGKLKCCVGDSVLSTMFTATRQDNFLTIAKDISSGVMEAITITELKRYLTSWTVLSSVVGGRGLHHYFGSKVCYVDGTKIWYSTDNGATFSDKTGDWAGFGNPINVHLLPQ